jgi:hypothetical protein
MKVAQWITETLVTYYDLEKISNPKVGYLNGKNVLFATRVYYSSITDHGDSRSKLSISVASIALLLLYV